MAQFTENGLIIDDYATILTRLQNQAKINFNDLLEDGDELNVDSSSVIGRILGITAEIFASQEDVLQAIASSLDPDQVDGQQQDKLYKLAGLERRLGTPASVQTLMLYGNIGSTVPEGSYVASKSTGVLFTTDNSVTFSNSSVNGIEANINGVGTITRHEISYSIFGKPSENPPIVLYTKASDTLSEVLNNLIQSINNQTSNLTASANGDNLKVIITDQNSIGDFNVNSALTITKSYSPVSGTSVADDVDSQIANTIDTIQSPVSGWIGVTNPFASTESTGIEDDELFRARFKYTKGFDGYGYYDALYSALLNIDGVEFVNIQPNITQNNSQDGRTNNGVAIVVYGGSEDDIAYAIAKNVGSAATDGNIVKSVQDINGGNQTVRFSRPILIPIKIKMSLITDPKFPNNGVAQIKQNIVDYFNSLKVGEDIYYSRLFTPINQVVGFAVNDMEIAKVGQTYGKNNITIKYNQLATISYADIEI